MALAISLLERLGQAVLGLLLNPFYYIGVLIILLQMRRQIFFERRLYHSRLHTLPGESVRIVLWGLASGLLGSLLMALIGAYLQPQAVIYMWAAALLLALIRIRFLCFSYVIGLLGIAHAVLGWVPLDAGESYYPFIEPLIELHMPSLLVLAGIAHILEALLIRVQGERLATPVFIEGKRGKLIGSYQFQGLWPVPLLLLVPSSASGQALPYTPLLGGSEMWSAGWMFLAMPLMIGFTNMTSTLLPKQKIRRTAGQLLIYGVVVAGLGVLTEWVPFLLLPAALLTIALHELILWLAARGENMRSPIYLHAAGGLTVLAVLPGSAAMEMGIQAGEVIHKVNGQQVRTKEELHQALRLNPAFSRLEVIDHRGEHRFVQRALFEGDHHQLGIILCPDDSAEFYIKPKRFNMFREMRSTLGRHRYHQETHDGGISG